MEIHTDMIIIMHSMKGIYLRTIKLVDYQAVLSVWQNNSMYSFKSFLLY